MSAGLPEGFRLARAEDAAAIAALVNAAYRGGGGWTTEAGLLEGPRIDASGIAALLDRPGSVILLLETEGALAGSVHLERREGYAYLGLLAVDPARQAGGAGKRILAAAEAWMARTWGTTRVRMTVLTARTELLAFYGRRGYRPTGHREAFPENAGAGRPLRDGLALETLEKTLGPG
ncbi:MAG TPA: GNAT family N-acetyltransferase [Holophagaceae bacterium]|nr:GNAT family N-acetyltransferase [Holophagaceae bacterium]